MLFSMLIWNLLVGQLMNCIWQSTVMWFWLSSMSLCLDSLYTFLSLFNLSRFLFCHLPCVSFRPHHTSWSQRRVHTASWLLWPFSESSWGSSLKVWLRSGGDGNLRIWPWQGASLRRSPFVVWLFQKCPTRLFPSQTTGQRLMLCGRPITLKDR